MSALGSLLVKYTKNSNSRIDNTKKQMNLKAKETNESRIALKSDAKMKDKAIKYMKDAKEYASADLLSC